MTAKKRLFISSDAVLLKEIASFSEKKKAGVILGSFSKNTPICYYSNVEKVFLPVEGGCGEASLFLVHQDFDSPMVLEPFKIGKTEAEDYLLYHLNKTKGCVVGLFDDNRRKAGHHEKYDPSKGLSYQVFAVALKNIMDEKSPSDEKVERIIDAIWPKLLAYKMEGEKILTRYELEAPDSNENCPDVFSDNGDMQKAFYALQKTSYVNRNKYMRLLRELNIAFCKAYK